MIISEIDFVVSDTCKLYHEVYMSYTCLRVKTTFFPPTRVANRLKVGKMLPEDKGQECEPCQRRKTTDTRKEK